MLSYAWNKLEEAEAVAVSVDDKTQLIDLFAKVLINATKRLLKRGIDRNYVERTAELAGIKGKIEIGETLKGRMWMQRKASCSFDEFSADIITNQILISTLYQLLRTQNLDRDLKEQIRNLLWMFPPIDKVRLSINLFKQVKIHRNNRFYELIIKICQLIYENSLPGESSGSWKFSDFTRDEQKMNQLFEGFVFNFFRLEQQSYRVSREIIKWQFDAHDEGALNYLPQMRTDINLENEKRKIIIDAKYYQKTLSRYYNSEKVHSGNLYQLFSYLLNQEDGSSKKSETTGILLYPTIDEDYTLQFQYKSHPIQIRTVNLNQPWKLISECLLQIVESESRGISLLNEGSES